MLNKVNFLIFNVFLLINKFWSFSNNWILFEIAYAVNLFKRYKLVIFYYCLSYKNGLETVHAANKRT
ncbi:hypothetical protein C3B55_00703 [Candidatus Pseudomonas adelgestsugas]|uniref:Uncharacterized protein n=1 Tax=Candidatus Pseudomonas adelgestsugas TaxID=1302376 RepID=A0ABX5R9N8_9PSED|nr:hypothetical protein C3B55_00703 [Candidatus Pseudomonas adelgestsugas]